MWPASHLGITCLDEEWTNETSDKGAYFSSVSPQCLSPIRISESKKSCTGLLGNVCDGLMVFPKCMVAVLKGSCTTNLSEPTLLNKVKEKNPCFSIMDMQWIQLAKDVL